MMKKIFLICMDPETSFFNGSKILAKHLQRKGHDVILCSSPGLQKGGVRKDLSIKCQQEDLRYVNIGPSEEDVFPVVEKLSTLKKKRDYFTNIFLQCIAQLNDVIKENAVHVVFGNPMHPMSMISSVAALQSSIKYLTFNNSYSSSWSSKVPPVFESRYFSKGGSILHKTYNIFSWIRHCGLHILPFENRKRWYENTFNMLVKFSWLDYLKFQRDILKKSGISDKLYIQGEWAKWLKSPEVVGGTGYLDWPELHAISQRTYLGGDIAEKDPDPNFDWSFNSNKKE